jgi:hypothetical protein
MSAKLTQRAKEVMVGGRTSVFLGAVAMALAGFCQCCVQRLLPPHALDFSDLRRRHFRRQRDPTWQSAD